MLEGLESGKVEFVLVGKFLLELKKEFGRGDKESVKVAEIRRIEQGEKIIREFVQKFWRVARGSGYEGRVLVEEFKREINGAIRRKLIEVERLPTSIEQWYECATNLNRYWKESREEKRLRGKIKDKEKKNRGTIKEE